MSLSRMFWLDVLVVHLFSKQPTENKNYCPNHMQASNKKRISNIINVLYKNEGSDISWNMQLQIYSFTDINKLQCLFFLSPYKTSIWISQYWYYSAENEYVSIELEIEVTFLTQKKRTHLTNVINGMRGLKNIPNLQFQKSEIDNHTISIIWSCIYHNIKQQ